MFQHHLLLIYRNFSRSKASFLINLIGLSTGLACTLLIFLWVQDELGVDKFHEQDSQLFQLMGSKETAKGNEVRPEMPPILAETLLQELPEVEYAVSEAVIPVQNTLSINEKRLSASGIYADKDYFKVFSYPLIQGDKNQVLAHDNNILISDDLAEKLFNTTTNVVGKALTFDDKQQFLISGIFTIPSGSSTQIDFVLPFKTVFQHNPNFKNNWTNSWPNTYIILKKETNLAQFNKKIKGLVNSNSGQENISLFARLYSDAYLHGKYENGVQAGGRIEYVKLFSIIAIFILLIACINFMNLSTAKASRRVKEVGVKKAVGADRQSLIFQYLGESMFMIFLSLLTALILVVFFLPQFNEVTGKQLSLIFEPGLILALAGITLFTGLVSGSYPALYLSGFSPVRVLKGGGPAAKINGSAGELFARKGLVVFQFTLSIILIVAVLVVYKQIDFIQNKNLGYDKDNIVYFEAEGKVKDHMETFLSDVKNLPGVNNASSTFLAFLGHLNSTSDLYWQGKAPEVNVEMQYRRVNYGITELLGIKMKEGRSFSKDFSADDSKIIFNEAAIELMGLTDPIGKNVELWGKDYEIVGIAKNFHFESLHENVKPLFFYLAPERTNTIMVKIGSGNLAGTIGNLQNYYKEFTGGTPLTFKFLDEQFQAQYAAEERVSILSRYFAGLAIIISCLGLFGLASFTAQRRRKEIGIRKALGSSDLAIAYLLSGDFTKLVITAIFIALPLSYIVASYWLDGFAYRIELELWYFIGAGLIALFVAWLTVGMQAIRAANINPVKALKYE
jgi:putative ABC transport system permease protein